MFSFLGFSEPSHWAIFESTRNVTSAENDGDHLNMFLERSTLDLWAGKLGLVAEGYLHSNAKWGGHELGQSIAVLSKLGA